MGDGRLVRVPVSVCVCVCVVVCVCACVLEVMIKDVECTEMKCCSVFVYIISRI